MMHDAYSEERVEAGDKSDLQSDWIFDAKEGGVNDEDDLEEDMQVLANPRTQAVACTCLLSDFGTPT
jgi:hypothetical protein